MGENGVDVNALWVDSLEDCMRYLDDISGKVLEPGLIQAARREEIQDAHLLGPGGWTAIRGMICSQLCVQDWWPGRYAEMLSLSCS